MSKSIIKAPKMPSGIDDFAEMIEKRVSLDKTPLTIADKTRFLPDMLTSEHKVAIFTRPIRFMKSSTFSMMARFLSIKDAEANKHLFDGLDISNKKYDDFRESYQGKFPIIHLTFKRINFETWGKAKKSIGKLIALLYEEYSFIQSSLNQREQAQYNRIMNNKGEDTELEESLADMITYLYKYYKKKVIILIDEYDTPLNFAYKYTKKEDRDQTGSYFQSMISFMSVFLQEALKGHPHLENGFMTGVSYLPFSSLFSSLNNTNSYSIFTPDFAELFGFTESEVEQFILQVEGITEKERNKLRSVIQGWYNGYYIGNQEVRMYNPWSVAKFFNSLPSNPEMMGRPYWLQVGDSLALSEYLIPRFKRLQSKLTQLMLGNTIVVDLDERTRITSLDRDSDDSSFWGLLLHSGYLSASKIRSGANTKLTCHVSIPNYEVQGAYAAFIQDCQEKSLRISMSNCNAMMESLVEGNIDNFKVCFQQYMEESVSSYDFPKNSKDIKLREQIYHAFMLGLLSGLATKYLKVRSNREAGYGRYDIALKPSEPNMHGLIFELKSADSKKDLKLEAESALAQIDNNRYFTELTAEGVEHGIHIGMSFFGKHFHIEYKKVEYMPESLKLPLEECLTDW